MKKTFTSLLCAMLLCVLPQTCKAEPSNNYFLDEILPKAIVVATIGMAVYMVHDALYGEHPEVNEQNQEHDADYKRDEDEDRDRDDRHEKKEKEQERPTIAQNEPEEVAPQEAAVASQESDAGFTFETSYQQAAYEAFDQFS